jgi:predicted dienelactone hydrolase
LLRVRDRYLALIEGGTHGYSEPTKERSLWNLQGLANPHADLARRYLEAFSLAFAKTYVARQPSYSSYLNAAYGQTLGQSPLKLMLVQSLDATPEISQSLKTVCDLN